MADRLDRFWSVLQGGVDCIRSLPESRRADIDKMLAAFGIPVENAVYPDAAYLDEIDRFDCGFFRIPPKEASLMDPNQRLFLETAWGAIEDSGYGGSLLVGSRTGVFVGYGSETDYKKWVAAVDPSLLSAALAGNTRPIIASRLSYLLDLKGPSLIVDTTCSSSLMAVHLACRSIREGESEMAVAGGVQLHLVPVRQTNIGIEAGDFRAKTFDESADGTGTGEGCAAIVLKRLDQALRDGDAIYAVIKGSATNHDGMSIGLTAPNSSAQEDVIMRAWKDAGVEAESISYIEAHGTGTKLGDPIEVEGMQRAFARFTDRKQFCAIGSVKTNIGHLDNSAGIAGLIKAVLALRHQEIPPSLHIRMPNRNIDFTQSPVYVNDRLTPWETEAGPRRCGVSSFGLSGTNCHVVLEEAPQLETAERNSNEKSAPALLALSAKTERALLALAEAYAEKLESDTGVRLADLCYTALTGRGHHTHRSMILFRTREELAERLKLLIACLSQADSAIWTQLFQQGVYYGVHRMVSVNQPVKSPGEMTEHEAQALSRLAEGLLEDWKMDGTDETRLLAQIARMYVEGANPDWSRLYHGKERKRIHLPTYPFEPTRCWLEENLRGSANGIAALVDRQVLQTSEMHIYSTEWEVSRRWILSEHKIMEESVLVGTAYLEMALEVCRLRFPGKRVTFRDVIFHAPLAVKEGARVETLIIVSQKAGHLEFAVESKSNVRHEEEPDTVRHVQCKILLSDPEETKSASGLNLEAIKDRLKSGFRVPDLSRYNETSVFEFGPRWNNIEGIYVGETELLSVIAMPESYHHELDRYTLYPSLMDNALTTVPLIEQAIPVNSLTDEAIFIPFSYRNLTVYRPLPPRFYSYVRLKDVITPQSEWIRYDIVLISETGQLLVEIEDYAVKKARKQTMGAGRRQPDFLHELGWIPGPSPAPVEQSSGIVLVIGHRTERSERLVQLLRERNRETIFAAAGNTLRQSDEWSYEFANNREGVRLLLGELKGRGIRQIVHALTYGVDDLPEATLNEDRLTADSVDSVFHIVQSLLHHSYKQTIDLVILSTCANRVTGDEPNLYPSHAAMFGLAKVIGSEYANLSSRTIDADLDTSPELVARELCSVRGAASHASYRHGIRYIEQLQELPNVLESTPGDRIVPLGTYLITGGTGGIGLEIAKCLASRQPVRLVLIGRSSVPDRKLWEEISSGSGDWNRSISRAVRTVQELEASGSEVLWLSADAGDRGQLTAAVRQAKERFGRIHGVIHSAGLPGDGFLIKKELSDFHRVFDVKVKGALLLDELTIEDQPDFFVLFSSNNTLLGMPGQSDYTAANSFLDAFPSYRNRRRPGTVTINWPAWKETGMAADYGTNKDNLLRAIPTAQALEAFLAVLRGQAERVIIGEMASDGDLNGMSWDDFPIILSQKLRNQVSRGRKKAAKSTTDPVKLPSGAANRARSLEEIETIVSDIWRDTLGFEDLNSYDNFFEIGGDSILITRVQALMDERFPGIVTVADLFTYTSISAISNYVAEAYAGLQGAAEVNPEAEFHPEMDTGIEEMLDAFVNGEIDMSKAIELYYSLGGAK